MDADAPLDEVPPLEAIPPTTDPPAELAESLLPPPLPPPRASLPPLASLKERSEQMALDLAALSRVRILFGEAEEAPAVATTPRPSLAVKAAQTTVVAAQKGYVIGAKLATWIGVITMVAEIAARLWPAYVSPFRAILNALAAAGAAGPPR